MKNVSAATKYPSLDLAFEWVKDILEKQSHTADALDMKTAALFSVGTAIFGLGFGIPLSVLDLSFSALVSLPFVWLVVISYACILSFSFFALWVRRFEALDNPIIIRESYWTLPTNQFKMDILSHLEDAFAENASKLARKALMNKLLIPAVTAETLFLVLFLGFTL